MPKRGTRIASIELLEDRTLLSAAMHVTSYVTDYGLQYQALNTVTLQEDYNGNITKDTVDWKDLNQINYLGILPKSDGTILSTSDSGDSPSVQLPHLVSEANANQVPVWVTVGGGDTGAINDWNALLNSTVPNAYTTFAQSLQSFCNQYGLVGVDFDWEPTAQGGPVSATEIQEFGSLIQTVKTTDPNLQLTAETLGDPLTTSDTHVSAYTIDSLAVQYLNSINVEAYPVGSVGDANGIMTSWIDYITGQDNQFNVLNKPVAGSTGQLQYGIDISSDDTSNSAPNAIQQKTDFAAQHQLGGIFLWYEEIDTGTSSAISQIGSELTADTGSVSGSVTLGGSSAGVAGATVYLDANGNGTLDNGEFTATTDSTGHYSLTDVPPGSYTVRQIIPSGDSQTSPANNAGIAIPVTAGSSATNESFVDTASQSQVTVTSVVANGNNSALAGAQRSMVDSIVYTFNQAVKLSGANAFNIAVHSGQIGTVPTLAWTAISPNSDGSSTQWAVTFSGAGVAGNSIANGVYDITLNSAAVTSDTNPSATVQSRPTDTFYRLFGDINGDGVVNAADNFKLKTALSTYNAAFDYNDDGTVNAADNFQFKNSMSLNFSDSGIIYTV